MTLSTGHAFGYTAMALDEDGGAIVSWLEQSPEGAQGAGPPRYGCRRSPVRLSKWPRVEGWLWDTRSSFTTGATRSSPGAVRSTCETASLAKNAKTPIPYGRGSVTWFSNLSARLSNLRDDVSLLRGGS